MQRQNKSVQRKALILAGDDDFILPTFVKPTLNSPANMFSKTMRSEGIADGFKGFLMNKALDEVPEKEKRQYHDQTLAGQPDFDTLPDKNQGEKYK